MQRAPEAEVEHRAVIDDEDIRPEPLDVLRVPHRRRRAPPADEDRVRLDRRQGLVEPALGGRVVGPVGRGPARTEIGEGGREQGDGHEDGRCGPGD